MLNRKREMYSYQKADFSERLWAAILDGLILGIPAILIIVPTYILFPKLFATLWFQIVLTSLGLSVTLGYYAIYAYSREGQTIGKYYNKIRVTDMNGNNLTLKHFIFREFIARGFSIIFWSIPFLEKITEYWEVTYLLALTKEKRALHDIIAGTQVIKVSLPKQL